MTDNTISTTGQSQNDVLTLTRGAKRAEGYKRKTDAVRQLLKELDSE